MILKFTFMKTKILLTVTCLFWQAVAWGQKATLVKDIWPGTNDSKIWGLISVGNKVIFKANNGINKGVNENKLWISDGTENGTVKLSDIPLGEYPDFFKFNNIITYNATDPQGKVKLFRTDGTEKGTFQIWDRDYSYWQYDMNLLSVDNKAYWIVNDNLDRSGIFIQKDLNNFEETTILDKNLSNDIVSFRPPEK
jgi:ELWxxDGT repeat protein